MATTNTNLPASTNPFVKTTGGGYDYDAINKRIQDLSASLRQPIVGHIPSAKETMQMADPKGSYSAIGNTKIYNKDLVSPTQQQALAARDNLLKQKEAMEKQGQAQGTALELAGASTINAMQQADNLALKLNSGYSAASQAWDTAVGKADEYVASANKRMALVMDRLDMAIQDVGANLDFAKTQALQSQVQGTVSEMVGAERDIVSTYGRGSPEHSQFLQSKSRSLQLAISNIHAQYDTLKAQIGVELAQGRSSAGLSASQQIGTAEQQHVNTLALAAQAKAEYAFKEAELALQVENFKALQMDNLVSSIGGMSVLRLDTLPFLEYIAEMKAANTPAPSLSIMEYGGGVPTHWSNTTTTSPSQTSNSKSSQPASSSQSK